MTEDIYDAVMVGGGPSGEGIYYAMLGGRLRAEAVSEYLLTGAAQGTQDGT